MFGTSYASEKRSWIVEDIANKMWLENGVAEAKRMLRNKKKYRC